jgi:hypothetical protein
MEKFLYSTHDMDYGNIIQYLYITMLVTSGKGMLSCQMTGIEYIIVLQVVVNDKGRMI